MSQHEQAHCQKLLSGFRRIHERKGEAALQKTIIQKMGQEEAQMKAYMTTCISLTLAIKKDFSPKVSLKVLLCYI